MVNHIGGLSGEKEKNVYPTSWKFGIQVKSLGRKGESFTTGSVVV